MKLDFSKFISIPGLNYEITLDGRYRMRIPDDLVRRLAECEGRIRGESIAPEDLRVGFYFAPAAGKRLFLYPKQNVDLPIYLVEHPVATVDRAEARRTRNFFYYHFQYVESDKFSRLLVPERLRTLAGIDADNRKVMLVSRNHYFELLSCKLYETVAGTDEDVFQKNAEDILERFMFDEGDL